MKIALAIVMAATLSVPAFAEGNKNTNNSYSQSYSSAHSSSRAQGGNAASTANNAGNTQTTNFRDRLQAPGFGVGGGYCADGLSISFPGGGFGFTSQARMCKTQMGAQIVKTYLGMNPARQYVCSQSEFRMLTACGGKR